MMRRLRARRAGLLVAVAGSVLLWAAPSALAAAITVNSTGEDLASDGTCTLPEAVKAANTNTPSIDAANGCAAGGAGPVIRDTIRFSIPGPASPAAPHVIEIGAAPLDILSDQVVVDGTTEPDYVRSPVIEIRESAGGAGALVLGGATSSGSLIRGLAISGASGSAIVISSSDDNMITGNYLGIRANGTTVGTVAGSGLTVIGSDNTVGGKAEEDRNLIAGNALDGITVEGFTSTDNALLRNAIGANGGDPGDIAIDLNVTENPLAIPFDGDGPSPNDTDDSDPGAQWLPEPPGDHRRRAIAEPDPRRAGEHAEHRLPDRDLRQPRDRRRRQRPRPALYRRRHRGDQLGRTLGFRIHRRQGSVRRRRDDHGDGDATDRRRDPAWHLRGLGAPGDAASARSRAPPVTTC